MLMPKRVKHRKVQKGNEIITMLENANKNRDV